MESRIPLRAVNGESGSKIAKPRTSLPVFSQVAALPRSTTNSAISAQNEEKKSNVSQDKKKRTSIAVPGNRCAPIRDENKRKSVAPIFSSRGISLEKASKTEMKDKSFSARLLCAQSMSEIRKIAEALLKRNEILEDEAAKRERTEEGDKIETRKREEELQNKLDNLEDLLQQKEANFHSETELKDAEIYRLQEENAQLRVQHQSETAELQLQLEEWRKRAAKAEDLLLFQGIDPEGPPALAEEAYKKSAAMLEQEVTSLLSTLRERKSKLQSLVSTLVE